MKLSIAQLTSIVATYVDESKVSVATFQETRDNTVGLLDTIGKIFTIEGLYNDKLEMLNGEFLSNGKIVEEWASDLILPEDYRPLGGEALSPHYSTYRPVYFSYTLGRKVIPQTIKNNDIERAVHNEAQLISIIEDKTRKMYASQTMLDYAIKRQALGVLANYCEYYMDSSNASTYAISTAYAVGDLVIESGKTATHLVVKPIANTNTLTFAQAVANGYLIPLDLVTEVAIPVDDTTGEDFIEQVKKDVEIASDFSEGHSLNGATLGATPENGLILLVKQGVMPTLDVRTLAGAFHQDKVALPVEVVVIKDFGNADSDIYSMLLDKRGVKLHPTYRAVRENLNGDGDFLNMFYHSENTVFVSRNVFVKVYKNQAGA